MSSFKKLNTHEMQLLYPLPMALLLLLLRYFLEKYVLTPVAFRLGIKPTSGLKNRALEKAYQTSQNWSKKLILQLSIKLSITERQVERWLRVRKVSKGKSSKLNKFCENTWKCLYYMLIFTYGSIIMWDKPWLWDINKCWDDIYNQEITRDIWFYYMIPLSFYWSLLVSQFFDVKRKDFWEMFVHHVVTIALMTLSWILRCIRVGTLVLLVHDLSDIFLEGSKITHYIKYYRTRDILFIVFASSWLITRLGVFPLWIIWNCLTAATGVTITAYYIFNTLLISLLALHCFWSYLLIKFIKESFMPGKMEKDIRSSSESEDHGEHYKIQ